MTTTSRFFVLCLFATAGGAAFSVQGCGGSSMGLEGGLQGFDGNTPVETGGAGSGGIAGGGAQGQGGIGGGAQGGAGGTSTPTCGEPGTQCCAGNGCNSGGCCVSGICMAVGGSCVGLGGGTCAAGACGACGGPGLPCCGSNPSTGACTATATKCNAGTCAKCGDLGTACCASTSGGTGTCNDAKAICNSSGICITCGTPGSACCPGNACEGAGCCYNNVCVGEATTCGTSGGTCQAGRCSGCGSAAQPCCSNLCYDNLLCKSGTCTACGGSGQTCCPASGSAAPCQAGTACTSTGADGVCARCGSLGDTCCAGNTCTDGCCSGGRCLASTGSCPTETPDASIQPDAPVTGSGGKVGSGGATGAGGVIGSGGRVGTGGIVGSGGTTSTGGCGVVIDDMEAATGKICSSSGRVGLWFTYVDTSTTSAIAPATTGAALPEYLSTARGTSQYAMHMQGYYSTYAGIAVWLNKSTFSGSTGTYNASAYTGITFWAKGTGSLIVVGQMASTEQTKYGGTCTLGTTCSGDSYAYGLLSSTTWKQISVPFTSLKGGTVTPFDPTSTWSFEFQYYSATSLAGAAFDLWIDDLSFY